MTAHAMAIAAGAGRHRTGGTTGSRHAVSSPRLGMLRPTANITTRITTNGRPSRAPYRGNHGRSTCNFTNTDWTRPMATPAPTVMGMDRNRPQSTAPRAGTRNPKLKVVAESDTMGEARMTTAAPLAAARAKPAAAAASGDRPRSTRPLAFEAAARTTSPNRVNRHATAVVTAAAMTMAINHSPSADTTIVSLNRTGSRGRIGSTRRPVSSPKRRPMMPMVATSTPMAATTRANSGARARRR